MVQGQRTINVDVCDLCGEHSCYTKCLHCKRDVCSSCKESSGKEFAHAVYFSGSGDGYYCVDCMTLPEVKTSALFRAYQAVEQLRTEMIGYNEEFKKRQKKAEDRLNKLLEKENS